MIPSVPFMFSSFLPFFLHLVLEAYALIMLLFTWCTDLVSPENSLCCLWNVSCFKSLILHLYYASVPTHTGYFFPSFHCKSVCVLTSKLVSFDFLISFLKHMSLCFLSIPPPGLLSSKVNFFLFYLK